MHTYLNSHGHHGTMDRIHNASSGRAMPQNNYSHGTRSGDGLAVRLCHPRGMSSRSCGNQSMNCSTKQNGRLLRTASKTHLTAQFHTSLIHLCSATRHQRGGEPSMAQVLWGNPFSTLTNIYLGGWGRHYENGSMRLLCSSVRLSLCVLSGKVAAQWGGTYVLG